MKTPEFIVKIQDPNAERRAEGAREAGQAGAAAIPALADVLAKGEMEVSRAAKRAFWSNVYQAGRPGAMVERKAVVTELVRLLEGQPAVVHGEALWMLSILGGEEVVPAI